MSDDRGMEAQERKPPTSEVSIKKRAAVCVLRTRIGAFVKKPEAVSDASLRRGVTAVVDDLRGLGLPPERVIVAVKETAREAGLRVSRSIGTLVIPSPHDALMRRLVCWTIDRYYCERRRPGLTAM